MNEDLEFKDIDEDDEEEVKIPEIHGTKNYMTRACYNRLLDERKNLVLVERPNVVNVVAWAASNGDRSENADYQYGKQRLREIDRRIRFLNKRIEASEVIDIDKRPPTDQIFFGATIVYANEQGDESKIRIVGIDEADLTRVDRFAQVGSVMTTNLATMPEGRMTTLSPGFTAPPATVP